ncbi:pyrroline-5-carboxylate reductase 1, mitochondrial-like [Vespa mandarinia]|uniref:pyrroline-5-carboxylate reductase 1, mitochondrial-like n=1 Tax=Vespa mandarinia TaxID=7446 RepID=UPI001621D740|nr:pyrroline-5-carboxylate reductase 1, mitochondrial-like [Vespa mandarinia]XP_047364000.1 pyrroline-5-carboxylate reductase 1, mitochondrial [Vespa velutina]
MDQNNFKSLKLGFIGGGNMAIAIGAGLIRKGILDPKNVWVSGRTKRTLTFWKELGAQATFKNGEVVEKSDVIFLSVKPHMLDDALDGVVKTLKEKIDNKLYVSILVGMSLDTLIEKLAIVDSNPRVIRSMPNTPIMVGEGITVYCSKNTNQEDIILIDTLFSFLGISQNVPESLMNAISGLSGSGPAYAYLIVEALADGAVKMGMPRPMATKFAAQVLVGAGKMVIETERHPGQLKDEVCSAGGTTITGVHAMERGQVRGSMMNAVEAAVNKANEMSRIFKA